MRLTIYILCFLFFQMGFAQQTDSPSKEIENPYAEKPLLVNQFLYFDSELIEIDFKEFESHFHQRNIDLLEKPKLLWGIEYGVQYKSMFFGLNMNFGSQKGHVTDSVDAKVNYTRFGLSTGYYLMNTHHFQCMPRVGININNIRLKNFSSADDIPLDTYTSTPDFKLTFSQFTAQFGLDLNYKIHNISTKPGRQPFIIGVKTAYNINLGPTRLSSEENKLKTNSEIDLSFLTFGLHFTILL